jgi:hypothetical protein
MADESHHAGTEAGRGRAMIYLLAAILHLLTGQYWSVLTVHGVRAACEITTRLGQVYANGCLR